MTEAIPRSEAFSRSLDNHFITEYLTNKIMLKDFQPRIYQQTILAKCIEKNVLVVLPTGLGKTSIAMMLAVHRLRQFPNSKILFLAPTKPLVDQHHAVFQRHLENIDEEHMVVFTGTVRPDKRKQLWSDAQLIFATPQGIENDLISRKISLENVSLLIVDEAHRATGEYSYTFLLNQYASQASFQKILGLTASPGSDIEKIMEVCQNLHIEDVEIRTDHDPDVMPYIQEVDISWVPVSLPDDLKKVQSFLKTCYDQKLKDICARGYLHKERVASMGKAALLALQAQLHGQISQGGKDYDVLKCISLAAEAMKVQHALELLETQSLHSLTTYLQKLQQDALTSSVKAVQNLVQDSSFKAACLAVHSAIDKGVEHPKLALVEKLVSQEISKGGAESPKKIILFTQFRDTALQVVNRLSTIAGVQPRLFVGQAKKGMTGMSQKQQKAMLDDLRIGAFNVLVATSVAEEGIDIPMVDAVLFYEPIPSAIRHIQRRGRTGRLDKGKVVILITKDTRDEGYRWSAHHKEKRMYRHLDELRRTFHAVQREEKEKLDRFIAPDMDLHIFVDDREKNSAIIRSLVELGIKVDVRRLTTGDYVLGKSCAVEYKTMPDFVDSIIDGRLLQQLKELKQYYTRAVVIVEGDGDLYSQRNIHPNAIRGMLATITVGYGIPLLYTKTPKDTASMLAIIAKREQENEAHEWKQHAKKPVSLAEQQEYIVSSLPGIGPVLAKPLLAMFGSVKNIVNAPISELQKVEKIGEKKALEIQKVLGEHFQKW
ncbi:DEAD/DEAH box helicase [Candidatus Woesearchaeota archaeon]|nr:DEAD/DEAH box helicase [Candidatus Woesearchaeota archaeon]